MAEFVFLELADRDLNLLFASIAETIQGIRPNKAPHLTVRGPYSGKVPSGTVTDCRKKMQNDVLEISSVGRFGNAGEEVVFLHVTSPNLRRIWWKPDYPISKFGFNPHISIYRGEDVELAEAIERFFGHEEIRFLCAEYRITTHVTRQKDMFHVEVPIARLLSRFEESGSLRENFLSRLGLVVLRHQRRSSNRTTSNRI